MFFFRRCKCLNRNYLSKTLLIANLFIVSTYLLLSSNLFHQNTRRITIRNSLNGSRRNFSTVTSLLSIMYALRLFDSSSYPNTIIDIALNTTPIFVSAWSSNHHRQAMRMCNSFSEYMGLTIEQKQLIIYDLGIDEEQYDDIHFNCPFAKIRTFNFDKYPNYVHNFTEYRWKALVIAEALIEFAIVWWIDSSAVFIGRASPLNVHLIHRGFFLLLKIIIKVALFSHPFSDR